MTGPSAADSDDARSSFDCCDWLIVVLMAVLAMAQLQGLPSAGERWTPDTGVCERKGFPETFVFWALH